MDIATLIGLVMCLAAMVVGIITSGGVSAFKNMVDIPSFFVTVVGSFMCVLASNTLPDFLAGLKSFKLILKLPANNVPEKIKQIIALSNTARKEGLLALEEAANNIEDEFLKKGLLLIVDGTDPELVKSIMEAEMDAVDSRHKMRIAVWEDIGSMGPAWGMIGTLIGLVNMLQNMDDPSAIGPNIAVALITTLYGSIIANWLCAPTATKLKHLNNDEYTAKGIMIEGILSIQAGENPRVTEEKLKSFLSPAEKAAFEADAGGGAGGGGGGEE